MGGYTQKKEGGGEKKKHCSHQIVTQGHLDLNVPGVINVLLNKESIVPKTGCSLLRGKTKPFPKETKHKFSHCADFSTDLKQ